MSPRELIILILGLAIVVVVLRGLYVAMRGRRGQIRLAIDKNIPRDVDLNALEMAELPSGGARVVARSFAEVNRQNKAVANAAALELDEKASTATPIPVLMDPVQVRSRSPQVGARNAGPAPAATATVAGAGNYAEAELAHPDMEQSIANPESADDVLFDYDEQPLASDNRAQVTANPGDDDDDDDFDDDYGYDDDEDDAYEDDEDEDFDGADDDAYDDEEIDEDDEDLDDDQDDYDESDKDLDEDLDEDDEDEDYDDDFDEDLDESYDEDYDPLDEDEDLDDDLKFIDDDRDEFSMTAGERIGGSPASRELPRQSSLFSDEDAQQSKGLQTKRKPLFAAFGRKVAEKLESAKTAKASKDKRASNTVRAPKESKAVRASAVAPPVASRPKAQDQPTQRESYTQSQVKPQTQPPLQQKPRIVSEAPVKATIAPVVAREPVKEQARKPAAEPAHERASTEPSEVVVINVMARPGRVIGGDDLLHELITNGMKFGDMNIFHRRLGGDNKGPVIFSIANVLNPGTFDLNRMQEFTTLGVSLFLALPTAINNLEAFEQMLSVARQLSNRLDGELRDDNRNLMTGQTIEHYRQRIRDFELRRLKAVGARG